MIDPAGDRPPSDGQPAARWLAAVVSGLLLAACFPPFGWGFLAWVAVLPLLWSLSDASPRAAAGRGFVAGFLFMAGVGYFTTSFGGEVLWMRLVPWALFSALEALFFIPVALALAAILRRGNPWAILVGAPSVWVLGEWVRGAGAMGFPFGMLGYALRAHTTAIQVAALGGVHMVSACAVLASVGVYLLLFGERRGRWPAFLAVAGAAASVLYGMAVMVGDTEHADLSAPRVEVAVAQGDSHALWDDPAGRADYEALIRRTLDTIAGAQTDVDLVVWSESSVPGLLLEEPALLGEAARVARAAGAPLLVGTLAEAPDGRPINLAALIGSDGAPLATYQKRRLVPFGEWVPLRNVLPLLERFGVGEEDQAPGDRWNVMEAGRLRLGTPICFESAAPSISRAFVRGGANLLVIITNDAWFFHTGMAEQHADVASLRAVETGRWVVRCGLTGISGFITPRGVWEARIPRDEAGAMVGSASLETGVTPFVRFGDWFVLLSLLLAVGSLAAGQLPRLFPPR